MSSINQHAGGMAQPDFVKAVNERIANALFDETAERVLRHVGYLGYLTECDSAAVMGVHVFEHLLNAAAVIMQLLFARASIRQCPHIARSRQIV